jgi:2-dehydropantoate 2-reductase
MSPHGDAVLSPQLISADKIDKHYDLVLLSIKAYALDAAMNDFAAAVGPETMIYPVLNGMRHIELLTKRFGEHAVIGGVCLVAAEVDHQGRIVQLADFQQLIYGERNGESTERDSRPVCRRTSCERCGRNGSSLPASAPSPV